MINLTKFLRTYNYDHLFSHTMIFYIYFDYSFPIKCAALKY